MTKLRHYKKSILGLTLLGLIVAALCIVRYFAPVEFVGDGAALQERIAKHPDRFRKVGDQAVDQWMLDSTRAPFGVPMQIAGDVDGLNTDGGVQALSDNGRILVAINDDVLTSIDVGSGKPNIVSRIPLRPSTCEGSSECREFDLASYELLTTKNAVIVVGAGHSPTGGPWAARRGTIWVFRCDEAGHLLGKRKISFGGPVELMDSHIIGGKLVIYSRADDVGAYVSPHSDGPVAMKGVQIESIGLTKVYAMQRAPESPERAMLNILTTCDLAAAEGGCTQTGLVSAPVLGHKLSDAGLYLWTEHDLGKKWSPYGMVERWRERQLQRPTAPAYKEDQASSFIRFPISSDKPRAWIVPWRLLAPNTIMDAVNGGVDVVVRATLDKPSKGLLDESSELGYFHVSQEELESSWEQLDSKDYQMFDAFPTHFLQGAFFEGGFVYAPHSHWDSHPLYSNEVIHFVSANVLKENNGLEMPHTTANVVGAASDVIVTGTPNGKNISLSLIDPMHRLRGTIVLNTAYIKDAIGDSSLMAPSPTMFPEKSIIAVPVRLVECPTGGPKPSKPTKEVVFLRSIKHQLEQIGELRGKLYVPDPVGGHEYPPECEQLDEFSRTVLIKDKAFVILDDELVEGELINGEMKEVTRLKLSR